MVYYIRHGESTGNGSNPGLSPAGEAMAEKAAGWLARRGHRPVRLVCTPMRRTRQTAEIVASHGWVEGWQPEIVERAGSVRSVPEWEELMHVVGDGGVFVGHHPTQNLLVRAFGAPEAPKDNRCIVYVLERADAGWRCVDAWMGSPKSRA